MKKTALISVLLLSPALAFAYGGYGYGGCLYGGPGFFGLGGGFIMWILTIAVLAVVAVFAVRAFRNNGVNILKKDSALDILKERFARGEITRDEFLEAKKDLQ